MRRMPLALLAGVLLAPTARAGDLRNFDDAALHAVQFMPDGQEGWAVGDAGVVLHTIDGGKTWDRQPTGVRASLRSLHFLNPYVGWVAGREEMPLGAGSSGVLLYTKDGGLKWHRLTLNELPGLNHVRFPDVKTGKVGYVVGDGTDQFPSGVFVTRDGGRSWRPVPGPRTPGWLAAEFTSPDSGALVGAWSRLGNVRENGVALNNEEALGGRSIRAVYLAGGAAGKRGAAVGEGGLVLLTDNAGAKWSYLDLKKLPAEVRTCWDFHAVHGAGSHLWAAGRPGSVLLHSADDGQTWEVQGTGWPLPLNGLYFHDEKHGWAVGEFGTVLATEDGGKSWKVRRRGGRRSALLFLHARPQSLPVGAVARLGGDEGHLATALRVMTPDPATATPDRAGEAARMVAAMRKAGGAAGEALWQFPLPAHLAGDNREELLKTWNDLHGGRAAEQLLRQLVLAIRMWRPDVLVTDFADAEKGVAADALVAEAVREAFKRAGDPSVFPEQVEYFGLRSWQPSKLYALGDNAKQSPVTMDLTKVLPRLMGSARDFAAPAAGLLAGKAAVVPRRRSFALLASHVEGASAHRDLMEGIKPSAAGEARRSVADVPEITHETLRMLRARANLQAMAETPIQGLTNPKRLLATMGTMLKPLPETQAAPAAHAIASHFVRVGQWNLARAVYLRMVERHPAHPLTADALRWLIRHNSSSETRRRHELGQFLLAREFSALPPETLPEDKVGRRSAAGPATESRATMKDDDKEQKPGARPPKVARVRWEEKSQLTLMKNGELRGWHQGAVELEPRLIGFGPLVSNDPALRFCLNAARRNLGDFTASQKWLEEFVARQPAGPWRDAAAAELWLSNARGAPPKPLAICRKTETKPFLDGKFDDTCWQSARPLVLQDASGKTGEKFPTKVWLAYDDGFLYVALRCEHPAERHIEPVTKRQRDADLRGHDRVSLLIDLDRDYATAFHFQVDQRGRLREDCWGDVSWNPRWFVAVHSEPTAWQVEAAIPLAGLTGDRLTSGRTWACNVVRTVPGKGLQAWSLPAGLPEQPRLEGMGLLMFRLDERQEARPTGPRMNRAP